MDHMYIHCGAKFWLNERDQESSRTSPTFAICCAAGKVRLPPCLNNHHICSICILQQELMQIHSIRTSEPTIAFCHAHHLPLI